MENIIMNFNVLVKCVCLCLSCKFLRIFHEVQSTSIYENKPCALDREVHFDNLYKRFALNGRRQKEQWKPPSMVDILFPHRGPKRDNTYNPTIGFEPYWPIGNWVFNNSYQGNQPNRTTLNRLCEQECPKQYIHYGKICAKNRNDRYETFENYCKLIRNDCTLRSDWLILYRGKCHWALKTYPTKSQHLVTRAIYFISQFMMRYTTTPPLDLSLLDKLLSTKK